ncbi:glycosyltransferase N-terminal domain-containing protein [Gluconobacter wancherniae]|uniref:3-deoxy-D-manno-octulosonic acid transferase n=1 Tax=Gluconobacter wancherniae NBRC 103581 TaxID=656744 RepID=A0A511B4U7_9PROT|nr:glycosyltransferase N-terminal domain-containing protein [Gluconobacter wancherniae]MBF0853032.1 DUF374 domain-containing protein [Gluconobacter wancherniae]GBD56251.1 3-deoxy-D-manno-octulosonic acid transferase [Gluconobacter wancherniae NBRC 103581]GBR63492.1 3-deoxy-D-manno-octulosonic-acid transferase [Gluconobacter wancherniae NBRC 103581]GEK92847.1 hypothetical protein GWA01_06170 [Gluconobacter wancherniae NBRC 103581]
MIAPTRLIRIWLGICLRTSRWQVSGPAQTRRIVTTAGAGTLVAFWHRSLTLSPALCFWARSIEPKLSFRMMVSKNRDGRLIADIVRPWGFIGIHGSSSKRGKDKGGAAVLRKALRELNDGAIVAITPDGPRGPAEQLHPGAIALSRLAKCPIVPIGMASNNPRLPSWDGLAFPLPFRQGNFVLGKPLFQPDAETLRTALIDVSRRADDLLAAQKQTPTDRVWRLMGTVIAPALTMMLRVRLARGRELPDRLRERMGLGGGKRPEGQLLWLHAASVGETLSALPLLDALLKERSDLSVLFTTATVTGSEIVSRYPEFGKRVIHRFIPHDVSRWISRFLDRWRPDGAAFIESELWPGVIAACGRRAIPVMLINGRLSDRSARRWKHVPGIARKMFSRLDWIAARGPEDAGRFKALGASPVYEYGDLKQDAPALPFDSEELTTLRSHIGKRPVFVAASTHPGEETIIAEAARIARKTYPDLLTVIVPRHPSRGQEIAEQLHAPRRSQKKLPDWDTPVWIADTLGELGLFYRLADHAFIGNSLSGKGGGHNPFEPLRLNVPTATGPLMQNWREASTMLAGTLQTVYDPLTLAEWLISAPSELPSGTNFGHSVIPPLCKRILDTLDQ